MEGKVNITGKIIAIKENIYSGVKLIMEGVNIVTDGGDLYYAQMAAGSTDPTNDFDGSTAGIRIGIGTTGAGNKADTDLNTETTGSGMRMALTTGYEKVNDTDADNTGSGTDIVTWCYYWSTTEGNDTGINEGAIVNSLTGASACLTHFDFGTTFDKTSADTLKVFVNHTFTGA